MRLYVIAASGLAFAVLLGLSHTIAYRHGRAAERVAALERSMDLVRERGETNAEISAMDDAALCAELGGRWLPDDASCR